MSKKLDDAVKFSGALIGAALAVITGVAVKGMKENNDKKKLKSDKKSK